MSCCYLIYRTFKKWEHDPVLVSFNERLTPISQIPFPAITICNPSPYDADHFNYLKVYDQAKRNWTSVDPRNKLILKSLSKICDFDLDFDHNETDSKHTRMLLSIANSFERKSEAKATFCQGSCSFRGIFRKTMTERGVCRSFNMLDQADIFTDRMKPELRLPDHGVESNWSLYGYDDKTDAFAYPVRNLGSGLQNGLVLTITIPKQDIYNGMSCFKSPGTFYMALHSPDEIPRMGSNFFKLSYDVQTKVGVQPKVTSTSDSLRAYTPKQRQCFFDDEKQLKFFKTYSQSKCFDECFAGRYQNIRSI
jgi:acid-sensing ion channel, other